MIDDAEIVKRMQKSGDACLCCDHKARAVRCPGCDTLLSVATLMSGSTECSKCGEPKPLPQFSGVKRTFGESDDAWQKRLKEHQEAQK